MLPFRSKQSKGVLESTSPPLCAQIPVSKQSIVTVQGSAIEHAASPALNYERWTMITSLMPASPWRVDGTDLQLAGTYSDADGLRRQFLRHKMATAVARLHDTMPRCAPGAALTDAFDDSSAVPAFETGTAVALLDQIIADLQHARDELAIARGDKTQSLG